MSVYKHFDTLQVHAGHKADPATGSCATPLYQTASFRFRDMDHAGRLFQLQEEGFIYSRLSNPTVSVLEERLAALEGCSAALAVSSGQAALFLTISNLALPGDNMVTFPSLYGGTYTLFRDRFHDFGISFRFAPGKETADLAPLIDSRTKGVFVETIANSDYHVPDFDSLAEICHKNRIPLVVDNTFGGGGYLFRPAEHGAAIITHSATKWIGGHGNSIAGILAEAGTFSWDNPRFPQFTENCPSYHDLNFHASFGNKAFCSRARALGLRDWGCCLSPFNAFLILQGIETLSLRMQRAMDNARELALWLGSQKQVERVCYPGLKTHPSYHNVKKYFPCGAGAVLSFTLRADRSATATFVDRLQLITFLTNVGDNKTLITHPASTTHGQMSEDALKAAGISPGTLRLSVGIEHIDDLKGDLQQALISCK
ncbi:MAG TPA: O-acetylhomoserine aminocarboxypropyltransferase/cysteine synthase [Bacteroidales bacterium]|jgi:O-acetylhomoserine (thiol)-lyase|nr:MAG: Methionine gamma-lyase [Bacteroidetes bacterium ADurb.Bin139]HOG24677.1 O-acetylhomoserine aminocarboxypropyltransferase/cysteine synthase [Bacteroidales bacterium]HOR11047.1 O-acetylhomoserine aminocarboxypropyltransferase/cysteine synthase [Bacteroidales bacterium]HOZ19528.1 O-acetylhomoserine aminocarboxypropyltransferase/cysteine synthase [Bacteroidales bacterium]HPK39584.1 O-acetylhomoserine aminocarboxypropyltransferase/cysteine synthase [Bacteroidales bacterium]